MKKALVLAMALVASVSFATTMELFVDGAAWDGSDVDIASSLSVVYKVSGETGGISAYNVSLSNAKDVVVNAGDVAYLIPFNAGSVADEGAKKTLGAMTGTLNSFAGAVTGTLFTIDFMAAQEGTLDIQTVSGGLPTPTAMPADIMGVNVVPEPMTMALLGLGGMLIRRKK